MNGLVEWHDLSVHHSHLRHWQLICDRQAPAMQINRKLIESINLNGYVSVEICPNTRTPEIRWKDGNQYKGGKTYLIDTGTSFGNKSNNDWTLATRNESEPHFLAPRQRYQPWFRRLIIMPVAYRCLVRGRLVQVTRNRGEIVLKSQTKQGENQICQPKIIHCSWRSAVWRSSGKAAGCSGHRHCRSHHPQPKWLISYVQLYMIAHSCLGCGLDSSNTDDTKCSRKHQQPHIHSRRARAKCTLTNAGTITVKYIFVCNTNVMHTSKHTWYNMFDLFHRWLSPSHTDSQCCVPSFQQVVANLRFVWCDWKINVNREKNHFIGLFFYLFDGVLGASLALRQSQYSMGKRFAGHILRCSDRMGLGGVSEGDEDVT